MLRKVVIGSIGIATLVPVVGAATPLPEAPKTPGYPPPMRPSELPIYEAPHAEFAELEQENAKKQRRSYIREILLGPVSAVREKVEVAVEHTDMVKHQVEDKYHELRDNTEWMVHYLREEENKQVRYGAVAMGGLTGFIFGLRGGLIRRVFYAGLGTTGMGLVCFPEDTKQLMRSNSALAKQYINIAYNFLYGVKPGDPQLEVKFPELTLPKSFSEFVELTVSVASSVKQAVMPPPSKDELDSKTTANTE